VTSAVGSINSTSVGVNAAVVSVSASSASTANANSTTNISSASNSSSSANTGLPAFQIPRTLLDPSAGVITQYLSVDGKEVLLQSPNAITVAYLRNGLERDGTRKPSATTAGTTA
jgi:hypothetical protein